ncbi:hypothetical protein GDO86_015286 [Hymenochirus boettgeri]|uniref:Uncharacterized protein n=1 Tax=Hymenochirus boettgeri TaxID=247094 RepID=A0A8T2K0F8_9PIPI|nr:hypothetical protein GDO86_015286 [Hymenochirus boettgeri]
MDQLSEDGESIDYEESLSKNTLSSKESDGSYSSESFESFSDATSEEDDSSEFFSSEIKSDDIAVPSVCDTNLKTKYEHGQDLVQGYNAIKKTFDKEAKSLQKFCRQKIRHICKLQNTDKNEEQRQANQTNCAWNQDVRDRVPQGLLNRLLLENMKVSRTEILHPSTCPACNNKQAELAQCEFIRRKITKLEALLLQEKMEEYMYSKDLLTCIGEIHQSLPRPSDGNSTILQRLFLCQKQK